MASDKLVKFFQCEEQNQNDRQLTIWTSFQYVSALWPKEFGVYRDPK